MCYFINSFISLFFLFFYLEISHAQDISSSSNFDPTLMKEGYIQQYDYSKIGQSFKNIHLKEVLEQGLRESYDEKIRQIEVSIAEKNWLGAKDKFFYPNVHFFIESGPQRIKKIKSGGMNPSSDNDISKAASGSLGLSLGEYSLFNWGKDYLEYENQKESYQRITIQNQDKRLILKYNLIAEYSYLLSVKEAEQVKKIQLRQASFIYRLNTERAKIKKISAKEYYQAREEYLRTQQEYHQALLDSELADAHMANLIHDPPGTKYLISEKINFSSLRIPINDVFSVAKEKNIHLLDAKAEINIADRNYEIALKDNLPLPKFSINFGAYKHAFGINTSRTHYETYPGSSNLEFVATINATWDIIGENGFLNGRKTDKAFLRRELSLKNQNKVESNLNTSIQQNYRQILSFQNQITILEAQANNMQKLYDLALDNYMKQKIIFIELSDALKKLTDAQIALLDVKHNHLQSKLKLAQDMGTEDFQGENFESLAVSKDEDDMKNAIEKENYNEKAKNLREQVIPLKEDLPSYKDQDNTNTSNMPQGSAVKIQATETTEENNPTTTPVLLETEIKQEATDANAGSTNLEDDATNPPPAETNP